MPGIGLLVAPPPTRANCMLPWSHLHGPEMPRRLLVTFSDPNRSERKVVGSNNPIEGISSCKLDLSRRKRAVLKTILVTGSSGLIGSEACVYFGAKGFKIHGIDNNQRAIIFGPQGDTRFNQQRLVQEVAGFVHHELDIRDRRG